MNCSTDSAPRVPRLKLSMNRTQVRSRGTMVPPLVTQATRRPAACCAVTNSSTRAARSWRSHGFAAKKASASCAALIRPAIGREARPLAAAAVTLSTCGVWVIGGSARVRVECEGFLAFAE